MKWNVTIGRHIRTNFYRGSIVNKYNFRLETLSGIEKLIHQVYWDQKYKGKWNISFGFILRDVITQEQRHFYSSANTQFFEKPRLVTSRPDLSDFIKEIEGLDILEWVRQQRPSTKYVVERITNMTVTVTKIVPHPLIG